ncbi:MAG: hypothetical protein RBR67_17595 [Desulfobacterium sp.]|nr:hypothetical protein [Desulfobacterium sp.]
MFNKNKNVTVQEDNGVLKNDLSSNVFESKTIVAIDNQAGHLGYHQIKEIIHKSDVDPLFGLAVFCNKEELKSVSKFIKSLNRLTFSVFGINPDYFFSLVPLDGQNRRNIEKYIFNLTSEASLKGKIKKTIKQAMIYLGLSNRLYERFVIIAVPEKK